MPGRVSRGGVRALKRVPLPALFCAGVKGWGLANSARCNRPCGRVYRGAAGGARGAHGETTPRLYPDAFRLAVTGHVVPSNPAHAVRGPRYSVSKGSTPMLSSEEATALLKDMDVSTVVGLRDRAIVAVMTYTFACVGAVVALNVEDYYAQKKRWWLRLHEKNGKLNEMPCHHKLEDHLDAYIEAAGLRSDRKGPLFRCAIGKTGALTGKPMSRTAVWRMVRRRASDAGIETAIGCHTFRATGITDYLANGGRIEVAQRMAGHSNAKTTGLYDRRNDDISEGEVEKIGI